MSTSAAQLVSNVLRPSWTTISVLSGPGLAAPEWTPVIVLASAPTATRKPLELVVLPSRTGGSSVETPADRPARHHAFVISIEEAQGRSLFGAFRDMLIDESA